MFSFGYSFFLSGPIIGYTSLSFYIFSIVFYMIHYFDTIAKYVLNLGHTPVLGHLASAQQDVR